MSLYVRNITRQLSFAHDINKIIILLNKTILLNFGWILSKFQDQYAVEELLMSLLMS